MVNKSARVVFGYFVLCLVILSLTVTSSFAQTEEQLKEAMVKGFTLFGQKRYVEAIPHLELLAKGIPDEPRIRFAYGFSLVAKSKQDATPEEAKELSAKALEQFKAAKAMGYKDEMNEALIKLLSGDVSSEGAPSFSKNPEAEKLMQQGESLYAQANYDEAIKMFQKALELDPTIYQAGLSGGDCYTAKKDWANAEIWYQKAIRINPNRETAYRYSATPLMKQEKYDQARDRYIEAFITEPYNQMSSRGISQWADITDAKLGHPKIDFPELKFDANGQAVMAAPVDNPNYNSDWKSYIAVRISWRKEKFVKTFPNEKEYRHTLQEEAEAIRSVLKIVKEQKLTNPQIAILEKLDKEGLLEAFILMAEADDGIAEDHEAYLKNNREKLRQYVLNYVIHK